MKTTAIDRAFDYFEAYKDKDIADTLAEARAELEALKAQLAAKDAALGHIKTYFEEKHSQKIVDPNYLEFHEYHAIIIALKGTQE